MKRTLKETTRQLARELDEFATKTLCICLAIACFLAAGSLLAAPYTFLAGGNSDNFIMTVMLSPITAFMLFLGWVTRRVGREQNQKLGGGDYMFWGFVAYLSLPILLNGTSLLLRQLGYEGAAQIVFTLRYPVLILLPITLFVVLLIVSGVMNAWIKVRGMRSATPPTPPSSPGQPPHMQSEQQPPLSKPNDSTDFGGNQLQVIPTT